MITIQKPCRRTIQYDSFGKIFRFNLPFPYVIFKTIHPKYAPSKELQVAFCNENPNNKSIVYLPPLSNIWENYITCTMEKKVEIDDISYFWMSSFTVDYRLEWGGTNRLAYIFNKNERYNLGFTKTDHENIIKTALTNWSKLSLDEVVDVDWRDGMKFFHERKFFHEFDAIFP